MINKMTLDQAIAQVQQSIEAAKRRADVDFFDDQKNIASISIGNSSQSSKYLINFSNGDSIFVIGFVILRIALQLACLAYYRQNQFSRRCQILFVLIH